MRCYRWIINSLRSTYYKKCSYYVFPLTQIRLVLGLKELLHALLQYILATGIYISKFNN